MTQGIKHVNGGAAPTSFAAEAPPQSGQKRQLAGIADLDGMEPMTSAQMQFAKLQLGQSHTARAQAHERLAKMNDIHEQHMHLSKVLRTLQAKREEKGVGDFASEFTECKALLKELGIDLAALNAEYFPSTEFRKWVREHGTPDMKADLEEMEKMHAEYLAKGKILGEFGTVLEAMARERGFEGEVLQSGQWVPRENVDLAIKSVQTRVNIAGTETQSLLTMVQDFMGQYNAYLQGARQAIAEAQALQAKIQTGRPG